MTWPFLCCHTGWSRLVYIAVVTPQDYQEQQKSTSANAQKLLLALHMQSSPLAKAVTWPSPESVWERTARSPAAASHPLFSFHFPWLAKYMEAGRICVVTPVIPGWSFGPLCVTEKPALLLTRPLLFSEGVRNYSYSSFVWMRLSPILKLLFVIVAVAAAVVEKR